MKFLVPNYSCFQNSWLGGYRPQIPVLSVLSPQLNLLKPPTRTKFLGTPLYYSEYALTCSNFLLQALYSNAYTKVVFDVITTFHSLTLKPLTCKIL